MGVVRKEFTKELLFQRVFIKLPVTRTGIVFADLQLVFCALVKTRI